MKVYIVSELDENFRTVFSDAFASLESAQHHADLSGRTWQGSGPMWWVNARHCDENSYRIDEWEVKP